MRIKLTLSGEEYVTDPARHLTAGVPRAAAPCPRRGGV